MKQDTTGRRGQRAWRGVTATCATVLALSVSAGVVVDSFRTDIDKFLGTQSTKIVTEDADPTTVYTYKSDYSTTKELLDAIESLGEQMSAEGTVLLKNDGALPLTQDEIQKVSLLGFSSYHPVMGGDGTGMGSSLRTNTGTDADTVDMVLAFQAKGFAINPTLQEMYTSLESSCWPCCWPARCFCWVAASACPPGMTRAFSASWGTSAPCWRKAAPPALCWWGAAAWPSGWTVPCWKRNSPATRWSISGCMPRWAPR